LHNDIIFIHAPSVYDFRKKPIFYGPVSDVIPSSPVFEMYPIGFMTICSQLEAAGYKTRIVNIAVQMLSSEKFDVEKKIKGLDADVYAIDLHWMPHAHGALELAKIVKKYHPDAKLEFGGFTSSYYRKELIQRPEIDLVMCGDTTEVPTLKMMEVLSKSGNLSEVPNLVWKDDSGKVHDNGITYVTDDLDDVLFDYGTMIKSVIRNMDIKGALPWLGWDAQPLTSVFTVRGCKMDCAECGGSCSAGPKVCNRRSPAFRSPEKLAEDIGCIQDYLDTPIFIVGDLRQKSKDHAYRFLKAAKEVGVENHVVTELFGGANGEYFDAMDRTFEGGWTIEMSPDSYDEKVRSAMGKGYSNAIVDHTLTTAFEHGCDRFDLFFMNGLPFQTPESALDSAKAAEHFWGLVKKKDDLLIYNAPFAPFVDPGSRAFEHPEEFGYKLRAKTLEEHRRLLDNPSWKHVLAYETEWMTRDDIAEVSYDAAVILTNAEEKAGRLSAEAAKVRNNRTETARMLMHRVDDIMKISDPEVRNSELWKTREEGVEIMDSTIADKEDLTWKAGSIWRNSPRVVLGLLKHMWH